MLHAAFRIGGDCCTVKVLEALVGFGVPINQQNDKGQTAIFELLHVVPDTLDVARRFLEMKGNPLIQDTESNTVVMDFLAKPGWNGDTKEQMIALLAPDLVPWYEVKAAMCNDCPIKEKVAHLIKLGFGSATEKIFESGSHIIRANDRLQLRNRLCAKSHPDWQRFARFDDTDWEGENEDFSLSSVDAYEVRANQRAELVMEMLVIPLLDLVAEGELKDGEVQLKSFYVYVIHSGVASFNRNRLQEATQGLGKGFVDQLREVYTGLPELQELTASIDIPMSRAQAWPALHQAYGHENFQALRDRDFVGACLALLEADAVKSVGEIAQLVDGATDREEMWRCFYASFLRGLSQQAGSVIVQWLHGQFGVDHVNVGPPKDLTRVMNKCKGRMQNTAKELFQDDAFAAGGVNDFFRANVIFDTGPEIAAAYNKMIQLRLETDGLEPAGVRNKFHPEYLADEWTDGYRDLTVNMLAQVPNTKHLVFCEVQILHSRYVETKKSQHILYEINRGDV
eukprot:gnl/MRDRNA2_/MRDRNA2_138126_c0_seq1.p1 gnl/MRDRNA2_/MRDRNA2_138126_c0~~gnl/MRDRNA2_/MRDRNA2_138126_c0_seq1.p1  ORF type:complete len:521 (+),score=108.20 gnl/MRDRNA2_/MRDRNA2_138126_c0_seq1:35-1564(+)